MTVPLRTDIIGGVSDPTAGDGETEATETPGVRHRPWRRSTRARYLGGVAAGAARWLDLDPLFVRVGLVALAMFWPPLIIVYLTLWLLLPSDASSRPLLLLAEEPTALRELLAVVALAVAVALLLPDLRPGGSPSLQLGVLLVAAGLTLLTRTASSDVASTSQPQQTPGRSFALPRLQARQRRRRPPTSPFLTPLAISFMLVLAGVVAALEWGGRRPVSPGTIVSLLMVLVGATCVVGAWWGRARGLLLLVPPLILGWTAFSLTDVPRHPGIGERTHAVTSPAELGRYTLGAGVLTVEAAQLSLGSGQRVTIHAAVTAGMIEVNVPFDAVLELKGRVGLGQVEVWDNRIGAGFREHDTGPVANRRIHRRSAALQPLCWPVPDGPPMAANPQTSSTPPAPADTVPPTPVTTYETLQGEPCQPGPAPEDPPVITIQFEIGAGALEVHRVEALD